MMVYVGCYAFSLGPIVWLLISEIFPLRVRGMGMSLSTLANWVGNFAVSQFFLTMVEKLGRSATFWIYASLCIVTILFVRAMVPETKQRALRADTRRTPSDAMRPRAQRRHTRLRQLVADGAMPARACESLRNRSAVAFETIVVDNASTDETPRRRRRVSRGCATCATTRNRNFAGACNAGARAAASAR